MWQDEMETFTAVKCQQREGRQHAPPLPPYPPTIPTLSLVKHAHREPLSLNVLIENVV